MTKVSWTVDIIQTTRSTQLLLVARTKSRVIQPAWVGVEEVVEGVRVGNQLAADAPDLLCSVGDETHRGEARHGSKTRVNSSRISHGGRQHVDAQATPSMWRGRGIFGKQCL